ncbi:MAG: SHOCT domain-containing protein [Phycisphaerales bacterium]|nr:SHOCT domain-containing protein [Phycisphaerales bacterium]
MAILAAAHRIDWPAIALWLGVLAALILAAAFVVVMVRRALRTDENGAAPAFTLQDLREMRSRGDLTEEEYQAARAVALGHAAQTTDAAPYASVSRGLSDTARKGKK